jgi:lipoate-protein ligase A
VITGSAAEVLVEVRSGSAAELHDDVGTLEPDLITVRWCVPSRPAIVLGSRQAPDVLDSDRCRAAGIEVVRRRSGGGAVLVDPGSSIWFDILVPLPNPTITDDLRASMITVGRWWSGALDTVLTPSAGTGFVVHEGPVIADEWGELVCFAGLGPGEITWRGAKLVGLSQRRTRALARFQSQIHLDDPTDAVRSLLSTSPPDAPRRPAVVAEVSSMGGTRRLDELAVDLLDAVARSIAGAPIA